MHIERHSCMVVGLCYVYKDRSHVYIELVHSTEHHTLVELS
jgi:hypothetical protein